MGQSDWRGIQRLPDRLAWNIATFSLFGNKIITTGEGGLITTNHEKLAAKMRTPRSEGIDPERKSWFPVIGYNYQLTDRNRQ